MDKDLIINQIHEYCINFEEQYEALRKIFGELEITKEFGEAILYDIFNPKIRDVRFRLYILMHSESKNLVIDKDTDYYLFREAYIMTDNIYIQLNKNNLDYNYLTNHLKKFMDIKKYMNDDEKVIYDKLNSDLILYRGMCNSEKNSSLYGISWTTDIEMAKKYVFYTKNKNHENSGWVAKININKEDIITIWKAKDKPEEFIINPNVFINKIEFEEIFNNRSNTK